MNTVIIPSKRIGSNLNAHSKVKRTEVGELKIRLVTTFMISIVTILFSPAHFFAAAEKVTEEESILIDSFHTDVTGDGLEEEILLKGILLSGDSNYYRTIWIEVTNEKQEEWMIQLGGGYEPALQFLDFNHDGVKDMFYQSPIGSSDDLYNYELHSFASGTHEKWDLPQQPYVNGQFIHNFQAEIEISPMTEPFLVDVSKRKNEYLSLELYDHHGKLLIPTNLKVDPIAYYEPLHLSDSKGYGLKSYQQISGVHHTDRLGTIETIWYFENGKWIVLKTDWIPSSD